MIKGLIAGDREGQGEKQKSSAEIGKSEPECENNTAAGSLAIDPAAVLLF